MLADHPQDLHDHRKTTIHKTNNDVETPAANNERRTPGEKGEKRRGGREAILAWSRHPTPSLRNLMAQKLHYERGQTDQTLL